MSHHANTADEQTVVTDVSAHWHSRSHNRKKDPMSNLGPLIWGIADQLRGVYKPAQYGAALLNAGRYNAPLTADVEGAR